MTEEAEIILRGMREDIEEYSNSWYRSCHRNRSGLLLLRKHELAKIGCVKYEPSAWLGRRLSARERRRFSAALDELEADDLILRQRDLRRRTRWVGLTRHTVQHGWL